MILRAASSGADNRVRLSLQEPIEYGERRHDGDYRRKLERKNGTQIASWLADF